MSVTEEDEEKFSKATECWLCNQPFAPMSSFFVMNRENCGKVREHCHLSSRYKKTARNAGNNNSKQLKFIPIFIHNLNGYEIHLFFTEKNCKEKPKTKFKIIPKTMRFSDPLHMIV